MSHEGNDTTLARRKGGPALAKVIPISEADDDDDDAPKFVFVDVSKSSSTGLNTASNSRLIHRHAMKEIGRSRRRQKKNPIINLTFGLLEAKEHLPSRSPWLGRQSVGSGVLDPFVQFPLELDAIAKCLVAYMFDDENGQQRPLRDAWFTVALQDEAAFSQALANSALHMEVMHHGRDGVRETPVSIMHYTRAITSLRRRLGEADEKSLDYTIGAVTAMLAYAGILGNDEGWVTHHRGLQELVHARGGIELLESNEALRLTISWCELRGVYLRDMSPKFPIPPQWVRFSAPLPSPDLDAEILEFTERARRMWPEGHLDTSEWYGIYVDLVAFSLRSFRHSPSVIQLTKMPSEFGAWSNPMIHRLLTWRRTEETISQDALIQETCRLGALLYLVPVWRFLGVSPVSSKVLRRNLKVIITDDAMELSHLWVAKLWSLYMGGVEALDSEDEEWYTTKIVEVLASQGIRKWEKGFEIIEGILWFECLFVGLHDRLSSKVDTLMSSL